MKAERAEQVCDHGSGALAHHSGRAEAERGRNVEEEQTIVVLTEVVVVAGINAKLSVGAAEVFFEDYRIQDTGYRIKDTGLDLRRARGI